MKRAASKVFGVGLSALVGLTLAYFLAFKLGWLPVWPSLFAALVGLLSLGLLVQLLRVLVHLARRRAPALPALGQGVVLIGALLALGGGLFNWSRSLQGYAVLTEGDEVPLFHGRHLRGFEAGPLANADELGLSVQLVEVELRPDAEGRVTPLVRLRLQAPGAQGSELQIGPARSGRHGSLRFRVAAFGFSPHIKVSRGDAMLLDQRPVFEAEPGRSARPRFVGQLQNTEDGLGGLGAVSLEGLSDKLRGHPLLELSLQRGAEVLGAGQLRLGHSAEIKDGHQVSFTGLSKWASVQMVRRNYPQPIFAGATLMVLGGVLWLVSALVRRSR